MDFEKLRKFDLGEWRSIHDRLYGAGESAIRKDKRLYSGNELLLTGSETDDVIEEAIELAMDRINRIKSGPSLIAYVARAAFNKARTRLRAKLTPSSDDRVTESLDAKLEKSAGFTPRSPNATPDAALHLAELDATFHKLWASLPAKDLELVWEREVMELPHKEIAFPRGWNEKQVARRGNQARERLKRLIKADPEVCRIIRQLGFEHYLK